MESVKQLAGLLALALPGAAPLGSTASTEGALASGARLLALGHPHLPYMAMAVRRYRPPLKGMRHSLPVPPQTRFCWREALRAARCL